MTKIMDPNKYIEKLDRKKKIERAVKAIKQFAPKQEDKVSPKWEKVSDFVYETKDPVTGGTWRYIGKRETSETQILQAVLNYMMFYGKPRPKKGEYIEISQPAID